MSRNRSARTLFLVLAASIAILLPGRAASADVSSDVAELERLTDRLEKDAEQTAALRAIAATDSEPLIKPGVTEKATRSDFRRAHHASCRVAVEKFEILEAIHRQGVATLAQLKRDIAALAKEIDAGKAKTEGARLRAEAKRIRDLATGIRTDLAYNSPAWEAYRTARKAATPDYQRELQRLGAAAVATETANVRHFKKFTATHGRYRDMATRIRTRGAQLERLAESLKFTTLSASQTKVVVRAYKAARRAVELHDRDIDAPDAPWDPPYYLEELKDSLMRYGTELASKPCVKNARRTAFDVLVRELRSAASDALANLDTAVGTALGTPAHPWAGRTGGEIRKDMKKYGARLIYRVMLGARGGRRLTFFVFADAQGATWTMASSKKGVEAWDDAKFKKRAKRVAPDKESPYPEYTRIEYRRTAKGVPVELWYPAR